MELAQMRLEKIKIIQISSFRKFINTIRRTI